MDSAGRCFQTLLQNLAMQNFPKPLPRLNLDPSAPLMGTQSNTAHIGMLKPSRTALSAASAQETAAFISSFLFKALRSPKVMSGEERGEALEAGVKKQLGNQCIAQKEEKKGSVAHESQGTQAV